MDPPDAQITVIARADQPGESYHSPANISVRVPENRTLAAQSRVVISRENYKTIVLPLSSVQGNSVRIKLAKALQYRLKYSLLTPVRSDELAYQDRVLAVRIIPREQNIRAQDRQPDAAAPLRSCGTRPVIPMPRAVSTGSFIPG